MKNTITAFIEFYFKGQKYTPSAKLDLDKIMASQGFLPESLYSTLAQQNGIDTYSYEFEIMEAETLQYQDPQGFVQDYLKDGQLDKAGFEQHWHRLHIQTQLSDIAANHLGIEACDIDKKLLDALRAAYMLGKSNYSA